VGGPRTILTSLIAAAALAAPAAQAAEDDWPILKSARIDGQPPWGAFVVYSSSSDRPSTGVSLYLRPSPDGPMLTARRVRARGAEPATIDWTTAKACAALPSAIAELEDLPPPRIDAPGLAREPRGGGVISDGASYFLWSSLASYSGGALAELEVRTVDGTPVADWIDRTLAKVEACWAPAAP
jgi:hypothetical protein